MYAQKMAAAIRVHGRTLREDNESVYLPFGSEYAIYLKNLNTVRASVKIEIDGADVTDGVSLVIDPGDSYELERFIKNGNLQRGNRFKFIEKTAAVEAYRGNRVDDGLVRIVYQFEKARVYVPVKPAWPVYPPGVRFKGISGHAGDHGALYNASSASSSGTLSSTVRGRSDRGITAPGSVSEQEFTTVAPLVLEPVSHAIVLRLVGERQGKPVVKTVTTRTTTTCETCGTKTRSATAKFCSNCGASLQLVD